MGREGVRTVMAATMTLTAGLLVLFQAPSFGSDHSRAKDLIQRTCVQCHRLEGTADSRFNLRAPDLIWAGSKYQRPWLIRWLTGKEAPLYAEGYRWDLTDVPAKHPMVTESEANEIADYFAEYNKDPRVTVGAFDLSKVTKFDVQFGAAAYKAHACLGSGTGMMSFASLSDEHVWQLVHYIRSLVK